MALNFQALAETFQDNLYPGMLAALSAQLGVSEESLIRLGVGYVPFVKFKKGPSYAGWYCTPERDTNGKPIGLTLRSLDGSAKPMMPGSTHGLLYEVNPEYTGRATYVSGSHNWVRTMDAGIDCPLCQKPDGCLLSSDAPSNPSAVICIRVSEGSTKATRLGHLHILKSAGVVGNAPPLREADAGTPVVVVEGMTDAAAAMDLGFVAVGRPSNLACLDSLADLLRSRGPIWIIGENDKKDTGKWPGREGALAAYQTLRKVCKHVTILMPPAHIKDLRAWKNQGLDREAFIAYHDEHKEEFAEDMILDDSRPLTIARAFLKSHYSFGSSRTSLRRWANNWYRYDGTRYAMVEREAFRSPIYPWAHDKLVNKETANGPVPQQLVANLTLVMNMEEALLCDTLIDAPTVPCWINGASGPDPRDLVIFQNGMLNVNEPTALEDATPDLFNTCALPFAYDPAATCPLWLWFLDSSLGDDPAKIALLQEWFGYCMVPDTSMQKLMYLRGPTGSGKGTIQEILSKFIGLDQVAATSFSDMSETFGLDNMLGKLVAIVGDCQIPSGKERRGLELLLNIAGEDIVRINQKYIRSISQHKLFARICLASNVLIEVPDHAGALVRRMNMLIFNRTFKDNPDTTLRIRMAEELPGIANWALEGLKRLRERGEFTVPESSKQGLADYTLNSSPVASFLTECAEIEADAEVDKRILFDAWNAWAQERRMATYSFARFGELLKAQIPGLRTGGGVHGGHKYITVQGIRLQSWAQKKFCGG